MRDRTLPGFSPRRFLVCAALGALVVTAGPLPAATALAAGIDDPKAWTDRVGRTLAAGNIDEARKLLLETGRSDADKQTINNVMDVIAGAVAGARPADTFDAIREETLGSSVYLRVYALFYRDKGAFYFGLRLLRFGSEWQLSWIKFDADIAKLMNGYW